jgi:hypothetical protein
MTDQIYQQIEQVCSERAKRFGIKPKSKKYLDMQAEFLSGAMAAMVAMGEKTPHNLEHFTLEEVHGKSMPPHWIFGIMRGDDVCNQKQNS